MDKFYFRGNAWKYLHTNTLFLQISKLFSRIKKRFLDFHHCPSKYPYSYHYDPFSRFKIMKMIMFKIEKKGSKHELRCQRILQFVCCFGACFWPSTKKRVLFPQRFCLTRPCHCHTPKPTSGQVPAKNSKFNKIQSITTITRTTTAAKMWLNTI